MVVMTRRGVVAAGGFDPGMPHHRAHEVQDHKGGHRGVEVDAEGVHAAGVEPEDGARLARAAAFLAGLHDQVLVQEAP